MDYASLIAAIFFWLSFAFTPGPFWIVWMNYHTQRNSLSIYKHYLPHLCFVFTPLVLSLTILTQRLNNTTAIPLTGLYFAGGGYIIYIAIKSFRQHRQQVKIELSFWQMSIISLTNPKVYLLIPAGSLSVLNLTSSWLLNSLIFGVFLMFPMVLSGSLLYVVLAKIGNQLTLNRIRYVTASLLLGYGCTLIFEGLVRLYSRGL